MKIALSCDEHPPIVDFIIENLKSRGNEILFFGPENGGEKDWPLVTKEAISRIHSKEAQEAIVMCWTGTGACLVANKFKGIRAALCNDAETAKGARKWNHANVLALSTRLMSRGIVKEILDAWFSTPFSTDKWNLKQMARIKEIEKEQPL